MTLVHHVCREAPGLESLFLISKSNCAFANFRDEASCSAAQQKLHDSKFQSVRLVSRLRKNTVDGVSAPTGPGAAAADGQPLGKSASGADGEAGSGADAATAAVGPTAGASGTPSKGSSTGGDGTPQRERYFILKSLTVEDLERSVRTGIWATQSHNEQTLNTAFKVRFYSRPLHPFSADLLTKPHSRSTQTADNVFLIFSANKSGEYFGYARMASEINEDPAAAIEFAPASQSATDADLPKAIPTEPTEFAPRGRIIDDSARGTIFWEIERDETTDGGGSGGGSRGDDDEDDSSTSARSGDDTTKTAATNTTTDIADESNKAWGKPFKLEWQSTNRLPFYRTRGLRNPWNSNREVKIARDGTELEPSVGRRLISLFRVQSPVLPAVPAQMPPAPTGAVPGYPPPPAAAGLAMRSPQPYRR